MDPLFKVHRLNNEGQAIAGSAAKSFDRLVTKLRKKIKSCRELAIAEMHLEQACFFVKKAIAVDPANHRQKKKIAVIARNRRDRATSEQQKQISVDQR